MPRDSGSIGLVHLTPDSPHYPRSLIAQLGLRAPATVAALGNPRLLEAQTLALFCSVRCPGKLILQTYDLALALRDAGQAVIGGFHSPMEQECLRLLLRGRQPIVVCPARALDRLRVSAAWREPISQGRLLLLSPFSAKLRRATAEAAHERNLFVAALADQVFISYAAPGGKMEALARQVVAWNKPLLTLPADENQVLLELGARPIVIERQRPGLTAPPLFRDTLV